MPQSKTWTTLMSAIMSKSSSGVLFSKVPKTFRVPNVICKTPSCLLCKGGLFICCKGYKNEITARFRVSRRPRFEDTKRIMSAKMRPKGFGPFGKQALVLNFSCLAKLLLLSSVQNCSTPLQRRATLFLRELNPSLGMIIIETNSTNLLPVGYSGIRWIEKNSQISWLGAKNF